MVTKIYVSILNFTFNLLNLTCKSRTKKTWRGNIPSKSVEFPNWTKRNSPVISLTHSSVNFKGISSKTLILTAKNSEKIHDKLQIRCLCKRVILLARGFHRNRWKFILSNKFSSSHPSEKALIIFSHYSLVYYLSL